MKLSAICLVGHKLLINVLSPPFCVYCKDFLKRRTVFCKDCFGLICPIVSTKIPVTKNYSVKVFVVSDYKDPMRSLILAKGYGDIIASRQLGQLVWDLTYVRNLNFDYIIPIPLHWQRFAKRGFNQAQEMADVISTKSGKVVENLLKRSKKTKYQSALNTSERAKNLMGAFSLNCVDKRRYQGKHLLLVDDLMTTGSTLKSAARVLRELRPASISAVVACRVV